MGSEPTGLALSPTGALLFVAEWGEGRVSVINTQSMTSTTTLAIERPYALAVTNNGDTNDMDELLVVPEFFGRPNANGEADNEGRTGFVHIRALSNLADAGTPVQIQAIDSGFPATAPTDMTAPNQFFSVTIADNRAYITSVSASPESPVGFNRNVHPVLYVIDLATRAEIRGGVGSTNLARLVRDQVPDAEQNFLADIVHMGFVGNQIGYVLSRGGDVLQRIDLSSGTSITLGSSVNKQIELNRTPTTGPSACRMPTGVVMSHRPPNRAFISCQVTRALAIVDLATQQLSTTIQSEDPPSTPNEIAINDGLRFFFTGRTRWSNEAWSACSSCHPGGYTDNITWHFPAGPRQSTSLDGSFSHGPGVQKHRIFNWTAIFDEVHDFERNTRGVSGGLGAITRATDGSNCANGETAIDVPATLGGLQQPLKELQDMGCTDEWDDVEEWMRTIRPTRARRGLDTAAVGRGRTLFTQGNCQQCHGGQGWTISRRFWTPSTANNTMLTTTALMRSGIPAAWNAYTNQIQTSPAGLDPDPAATEVAAPGQVGCVIRNVATFGVRSMTGVDLAATSALEQRQAMMSGAGTRAQGAAGYNVPSLYGLQLGAPYLHHGQARTLEELLDPRGAWRTHVQAGNAVFLETDTTGAERADLIQFLLSIDARPETQEIPVPAGFDVCPTTFP